MFQILHIFRKDARRHWLEILASLVLLGAYANHVLHPWPREARGMYLGRFFWMNEFIEAALILFWFFLILRIVQGETLVGDGQWWVTKPYVWWKLFLSKCLFVLAVISIPLFFVQLYLLFINGFPVFSNFLGVLGLQAGLAVTLFLIAFLLASLTRNLAQAILTIVGLFAALYVGVRLFAGESGSSMSGPGPVSGNVVWYLLLLFTVGLLLWQFAFRRTWQSRGLLCLGVAFVALLASLPGAKNYVETTYPLAKDNQSPARIEMNLRSPDEESAKEERWSEFTLEVPLRIPLKISGLTPGSRLSFEGIRLTLAAPDGAVWTRGWRASYGQVWPEDEALELTYGMKREDFKKWKNTTVRVHIELAISRYIEDQPRELVLHADIFSDPQLGNCRINPDGSSNFQCLRPFHNPAYMITFDGQKSPCKSENGRSLFQDTVWHSWSGPYDFDLIEPGLSPITAHAIYLQEPKLSNRQNQLHELRFCEGAKVRIAYPKLGEKSRVELEIPAISVAALSRGLVSLN